MTTKAHSYLFLYIGAFVLMLFLVITASKTMEYETSLAASVGEIRKKSNSEGVRATPPSIFNPNKKVVRQIKNFNANEKKKRSYLKTFTAPIIDTEGGNKELSTKKINDAKPKDPNEFVPTYTGLASTFLNVDEPAYNPA
jgi:hypothetical protein